MAESLAALVKRVNALTVLVVLLFVAAPAEAQISAVGACLWRLSVNGSDLPSGYRDQYTLLNEMQTLVATGTPATAIRARHDCPLQYRPRSDLDSLPVLRVDTVYVVRVDTLIVEREVIVEAPLDPNEVVMRGVLPQVTLPPGASVQLCYVEQTRAGLTRLDESQEDIPACRDALNRWVAQ